jgi:hypothetical protein
MGSLLGGKQKSTSTSVTRVDFPDWIEPSLRDLITRSGELMDKPYEAYTGDRLSQFNADELSSFDLVRQLTQNAGLDMSEAQGITRQVADRGLNGFDQSVLDQYMNPYIQNVMDISKQRQLDDFDRSRNQLTDRMAQVGAFGGSRAGLSEQTLYDNFSRQMAEQEANQLAMAYESSQNRAFQGTQLAGQSAMDLANLSRLQQAQGLTGATALSAQGAQQRGLNQAGLDVDYQEFLTQQAYPYQQLQFGAGMINPIAQMSAGQTNTQTNTQSGGSGALGTVLGLASMAMGIPGVGAAMMGGMGSMASGLGMSSIGGSLGMGATAMNMGMGAKQALGVGSGLQSLFNSGLGTSWKEGGQVKVGENNNITSKVDGFLDLLKESERTPTPEEKALEMQQLLEEMRMIEALKDQQGIAGYKCGGMVKNYNQGGLVRGPNEFNIDILRALGRGGSRAMEPIGSAANRMATRYNSTGGMSGSLTNLEPIIKYLSENPGQAAGIAASVLPVIGPAVRGTSMLAGPALSGSKAAATGIASLIAKHPSLARFATSAGGLTSLWMGRDKEDAAVVTDDPNDPQAEWEAARAAQENAGLNLPMSFNPNQVNMDLPAVFDGASEDVTNEVRQGTVRQQGPVQQALVEAKKPKQEMNLPLIAFGAALLGSKNDFFQALGEAGTAYAGTAVKVEDRIKEEAQKELERKLEERRIAAYERQVEKSGAAASDPYTIALKAAKLKEIEQKLSRNPEDKLSQELLIKMIDADPRGNMQEMLKEAKSTAKALLASGVGTLGVEEDIALPEGFLLD